MNNPGSAPGRDSRWRLGLLAGTAALLLALPFAMPRQSVFFGEASVEEHARSQKRQEIRKRFEEGVVMLHAKQYDHAMTAFHRVLELDPKMPEAHVNLGFALLGLGNPKAAADFFDSATTLRPDQMNAYFGLGEALDALGDKQGALQAMETYLHRAPASDPFRTKAEAAVWELREALAKTRPPVEPGPAPHRRAPDNGGAP